MLNILIYIFFKHEQTKYYPGKQSSIILELRTFLIIFGHITECTASINRLVWQARIMDNKINNKWATTIYVWLIKLVYRAMYEYIPGMLWSDTTRIVSWASRNVHIPDCSGLHAQRRAALAWNKKRHMISRYLRSTICRHTHTHTRFTRQAAARVCHASHVRSTIRSVSVGPGEARLHPRHLLNRWHSLISWAGPGRALVWPLIINDLQPRPFSIHSRPCRPTNYSHKIWFLHDPLQGM